ncbi:MAG: hypothetical protein H7067_01485 [Burkholderiales bacterium]|nr:hypothetical protein [Opitutaceae bacterium]
MQTLRSWVLAVVWVLGLAVGVRAEAPAVTETQDAVAPTVEVAPSAPVPEVETQTATETAQATAPVVSTLDVSHPALANLARDGGVKRVKVIPVRDGIDKPILYVLRRGLKEAQAEGMQAVVIDMDTPGGRVDVTLDIMEALDKFDGETLVYINKEAISAGAIISSVTDEIHFAPGGVIGAAAVVGGGGEDVAKTMQQKINSYLNAKVRSFSEGKGHRAEVIKAMMDTEYEFKIGDVVIKPKGELLSLTANEAGKTYGDPATPLLSSGTHDTLEAMLDSKYGKNGYTVNRVEVSWSEELASWLSAISPLLMGIGLLCVFVELKTPGFGVFGITGGLLLALVFFGHYAAGLSGHEPALVFLLGVVLVVVELFIIPGTLVAGLTGALLMLGALAWSMIDVWPNEMPKFDQETLLRPVLNVFASLGIAIIGALALARFLPRGWFWDKMILQSAVAGDVSTSGGAGLGGENYGGFDSGAPEGGDGLLGASGVTVSVLRPMGEVEIAGRRHEARADLGSLERGEAVRVVGRSGRTLIVASDKN